MTGSGHTSRLTRGIVAGTALGVAALAGWLVWRWFAPVPATLPPLVSASADQVEAGAAIYRAHCASCHGADLEGEPDWRRRKANGRLPAPPHDDSGHTWHHPDEVLIAITRHGPRPPYAPEGYQSDMPGFAGVLDDREIWLSLAYIASRWSERARAHQARIDAAQSGAR